MLYRGILISKGYLAARYLCLSKRPSAVECSDTDRALAQSAMDMNTLLCSCELCGQVTDDNPCIMGCLQVSE